MWPVLYRMTLRVVAADSWPQVFDDSNARHDWGWKADYDIDELVNVMCDYLEPVYKDKAAVAGQR